MLTTTKTAQELIEFFTPVWDVAVPTTAELHILFSELGQVQETPTKRFPKAFTLHRDGKHVSFLTREQAWHWYCTTQGIYRPIVLPWKLPFVN